MKATFYFYLSSLAGIMAATLLSFAVGAEESSGTAETREQMSEAVQQGNFKDAYEGLHKLILDPNNDGREVGGDLNVAVNCLQRLNRVAEIDALLEEAVKVHKTNWRLLATAADQYMSVPHFGFIVAGKFERGQHRGGANLVNSAERDRVRALQLMLEAMPLAMKDDDHAAVGDFLQSLARMLLNNRGYDEAWRLQYLTDLNMLPDYESGWGWEYGFRRQAAGAPVDADGHPVFYHVPKSFAAAANDGQRWRWCLQQTVEMNPQLLNSVRTQLADFLRNQFGVQTLAQWGWHFGRMATDDTKEDQSGTYALHTLKENETITRLATGIKRFDLPDEFNYIKIYQQIAAQPDPDHVVDALYKLAQIFENRRQYPRAAEYWRRLAKDFSSLKYVDRIDGWQRQLDQIVGNWGRFESTQAQPAGRAPALNYRFRNGDYVEFTAREIDVKKLLDDVKDFLKSNPRQLDWQKVNIGNIGYRLVQEKQEKYLGQQVAQWQMPLRPREKHFDKLATVHPPLSTPGAYLVTATMKGGNTSMVIVWIDDTAIVKKSLSGKMYYFVADAASGKPITKANVEFFGWQQVYHDNPPKYDIYTKQFAEFTDADGQIITDPQRQPPNYQWLLTATTGEGRFAYLGFTGVWYPAPYDAEYNAMKVYTITDRPVYRPGQKVKYKFWIRHAKYDMEDGTQFVNRQFNIWVHNPRGEKVASIVKMTDAYCGIEGEYAIPADATLGVYQLYVLGYGGGSFRVEEYKKPEFEVTVDAPTKPVMLGEKITATIKAKYYFGSPVTKAKVKYKVNRSSYDERWYPVGPWDWLYGPGYWWFACDYDWYPGWHNWGCPRPMPFWWPHRQEPPELVADQEVEIGPDGTVKVEIDTGVAKAIHPDEDHSYTITAEVVDASRRTIVGTGTVLVARKPFSVYAWLDRGYYNVGDTIHAHFSARTLDGKPVEGKGEVTLLKISYKDGKPVETPVQTWPLSTNAEGTSQQQMTASQAGQYRISYKVADKSSSPLPLGEGPGVRATVSGQSAVGNPPPSSNPQSPIPNPSAAGPHPNPLPKGEGTGGHTIEGGYLFTTIGERFDGSQFRFNHVELIPDRETYVPGDTVKLQINTDRAGGTVLLFVRPTNGVYLPPTVLRLDGKSTVVDVGVVKKDMPNFFIEADTVADGRLYTEAKEIVVPPEKRILNVEIQPSKAAYKPGEKAKVNVKLTDLAGRPFVGSTVVAIYDKSVEYISGGSNVPDIKEFFWKWRRYHNPQSETSLGRWFYNLVPPGKIAMSNLGIFGGAVAEELTGEGGGAPAFAEEPGEDTALPAPASAVGGGGGGFGARGMIAHSAPGAAGRPMLEKSAALPTGAAGPPGGKAAPLVQPTIRTKFADTALWVGNLTTADDGTAEVSLDMPENLTTWRIKVWGMGQGTRVGQGQTDVVTRKDLIIRMEAPRFFVQTDEVVLSAVVHNYLKTKKSVEVALDFGGNPTAGADSDSSRLAAARRAARAPLAMLDEAKSTQTVEIAPNGEARVDWTVKVLDEGEAVIRVKALTDEESDAMEQRFPCYIHGMSKMDSYCGEIRPDDQSGKVTIDVPDKRRPKDSRLEVRFSPTLAGAMVDALPYMVDYPYGCTEQTLNRFLPTVITQKVLLDMHLDLRAIEKKQTNLNAQEIGNDADRAKQWKQLKANGPHPNPLPKGEGTGLNPVFDVDEVQRMVKEGVERLTEMQCSDGGWGWFSGWGEHSMPHTTAVVVHGLQIAKQNDVALVPGVLDRGVAWLKNYQDEQIQLLKNAAIEKKPEGLRWKASADSLDAFVYMVLIDAGVKNADMLDFLYRDRTKLGVYGMAMFGIALDKQGERDKLAMLLRNIGQYVQQDDENQTAWLNMPEGCWWFWYGSEFEAEAYYLKLLARTDPHGELARRLVKYLLNNRKNASYWNSTRDTALCIEAMADFIRASGENQPNMTVEIYYDGKLQKAVEITPKVLFQFDNKFVLEGDGIAVGKHTVELHKKGSGPLYYNAYLTTFTLEDFIPKSKSVEIKVARKYYKLLKADKSIHVEGSRGQAVEEKVEKYQRQELPNLSVVHSGDLVEIELEIDSKNDYEYLVFEDMKPAGFEPVDLRSGYTGNDLGAYVEFRDNRVVFFARTLARGKHSVSYRMRAEIPGRFSALPTRAAAMYAPELKANSDELKIGVKD
ncbi:MAG: MG2 domain-containing protein [Thermoguttaceae bacterium]